MEDTDSYSDVNVILRPCIWTMFLLYAVLFAVDLHNIVRYVYRQKRFRFFHISCFYVLVTLVIICRVAWMGLILAETRGAHYFTDKEKAKIFGVDVTATYLELLLGIQQVSSMQELYLMIKKSVMSIEVVAGSEKSSFLTQ